MSKESKPLELRLEKGQTHDEAMANAILSPNLKAGHTITESCYSYGEDLDINKICERLSSNISECKQGNFEQADELLISQAHTLDTLFHKMALKSLNSEYLEHMKAYMAIALKAQNQCRMALDSLANIKNPRPYIQNNKAQYQQVNNGEQLSRAEEKSKTTNELLTDGSNEYEAMDTRRASKAGGIDKDMEAVGEKHRSKD